jgi:hypothetical protein
MSITLAFYLFQVVRWTELELWGAMVQINAFTMEREEAAGQNGNHEFVFFFSISPQILFWDGSGGSKKINYSSWLETSSLVYRKVAENRTF